MMTLNLYPAPTDEGGPYKQKFVLGGDTWHLKTTPKDKWAEAKLSEETCLRSCWGYENNTLVGIKQGFSKTIFNKQ